MSKKFHQNLILFNRNPQTVARTSLSISLSERDANTASVNPQKTYEESDCRNGKKGSELYTAVGYCEGVVLIYC